MNRIFALAIAALLASAGIAFADGIPVSTPQGNFTLTDETVQWLCGDNGAWIRYFAYLFGGSVLASAISNYADKLPAPVRMIVNVLALNLRNAKPPAINPNLSAPKGP